MFSKSLIDDAVDQWPTCLHVRVCASAGHFEHLVTVNLFSLYLINFVFHTTLDAVGMKCDVSFSQGSVSVI